MSFVDKDIFYLIIPVAYLLGSIPTGVIMARIFGSIDPRLAGSKNIGATNVSRTAGKTAGILTLIGDVLKGALPVLAVRLLRPEPALLSAVALAAFVGHLFPVFLKFKGGKGVATALGVLVVISPISAAICLAVFILIVAATKYVSLGSIIAAAIMPVLMTIIPGKSDFVVFGVVMAALIIIKHRANIQRLATGTENKLR